MGTNTLGRNITLPIYNADGTSFNELELTKFTSDSVVMSLADKITGDVYYKDNGLSVAMTEYVLYNGVKYVLVNPPTVVREGMASDNGELKGMTKYSFEFYHPMYQLSNLPFTDVAVTSSEEKYLSQNKNFSWVGYPSDFFAKLNKNLESTQWIVVKSTRYPSDKETMLSGVLSFNDNTIADALKMAYDTWGVAYVISQIKSGEQYYSDGKRFMVTFGLPTNEIYASDDDRNNNNPYIFEMGKGVGLKNNSRTPRKNKIVTRISGYGSEDNIPYGYPQIVWTGNQDWDYTINNDSTNPNSYPIYKGIVNGAYVKLIKHPFTRTHLMPSVYAETVNKKVNPNATGYDPTIEIKDYYDAIGDDYPNPINTLAPSYDIHEFNDIKPELGQVAITGVQPINNDKTIASDWDDSINDNGEYVQGYFQITLPILDFDIYACAAITQQMQINMRSGACIGCTFTVQVDWDDYRKNFYTQDGDFAPQGDQRDLTKYPNSTTTSVTLILQKDTQTFGTLMPNIYQKPKSGDEFVVLGISMPLSYITNAETRLDNAMMSYMLENNIYYFDYPLKFDEHFLATHTHILEQIHPNSIVHFKYGNETLELFVKQLTIKYGQSVLPQYDITLADNVEVVLNQIGQVADSVEHLSSLISILRQGYNQNVFLELARKLSKTGNDTARGVITFLQGLVAKAKSIFVGIKNTGDIENEGNITNTGDIRTKNLTVTGKATFFELEILKAKAAGGTTINSPGTFHADLVEDTDAGYVLYQRAEQDDKTLMQMVEEGDQLFCCDFNVGTGLYMDAGNRYYWRRVTAAPTEYVTKNIDGEEVRCLTVTISKTDRDLSSDDAPQVGDDLMVLGSRTNPDRQSAIMTSAYRSFDVGLTAPYTAQYIGINDYDLASHRRNYQAANGNKFVGRMEIVSNGSEAVSAPVPCDLGPWMPGMECGYYDRVSYTDANGNTSLWLCLVEPGHTTTDAPGTSDAWRLQVAGTSGKDGTYYFIYASHNVVRIDKDGNADTSTVDVYGAWQDGDSIRAISGDGYTLYIYKDTETVVPIISSGVSYRLSVDATANKYIIVLKKNGSTVSKLTIPVIRDGDSSFSITASPGTVIINQSTSKSGGGYPLQIDDAAEGSNTEILLHVFRGSEEIPVAKPAEGVVGFSINTITPNHCTAVRTADNGTTYNDRVWINSVGTYAENGSNKYYRTGYVDLEVLYGNSIIGIVRAAFACNLNGEFKEVIDRDFSGRYASKTEFNNLSNNAITQSEMESAIEQKSEEILSTVQDVTDGINTQITTIRQTAQSISMKVGEVSERRNMLTGTAFRRLEEILWNNNSYPCMISTSVQYRGTNSVLIDCAAETNADGSAKDKWQGVTWNHIKVTPGKMYQWSFWYRTRTKDLTTEVKAFDANGKELNRPVSINSLAGTNTDGTWHLFKVNFIPTDGTVTVNAMVYIIYSGKAYVARPMLEEADDYGGWTPSAQDYDYTGGNLIAGSRLFDGDRMSNGASTVTPNGFGEYSSLEINTSWEWKFGDIAKPNTEYIFSCYVNNYGDMTFRLTSGGSCVFAESSDGNVMDSARTDGLVTISAHNKWTRIWVHFKTSANVPSGTRIALRWVTSSNIHQIAAPKLEYGATVTDWTESADDKVSKAALLNTGIDIVNRKIKAIGDMFEWLNNQGEKKVFFDNNTGEYNFSGNVVATTFSGGNGYFKVLPNGASWSTGLINYGNMYLVDGIDDTDILAIHANGIGGAPMISFYYNSTLDNKGNPQYDRITTQSDGGRNMIIAGGASSVSYPMSSQSFGDTDGAGPFIAIGNSSSEINSNRPSNITNTLLNSHLLATPKVLTNRLEAKSIVSNMEILNASKTVGNPGTIYVCKNTSQITINLGSPSSHKGELYIFVRAGNNITFTGTNLSYWNGRTGNSITSTTAHEIIFAICDGAIWHLQTINN